MYVHKPPRLPADDELFEVPADVALVAGRVGYGGELLVDRMAAGAVDVDLLGQREKLRKQKIEIYNITEFIGQLYRERQQKDVA